MQKKFGIVVVAAIQGVGKPQQNRPGVSKSSRRRPMAVPANPIASAA